MKIILPLLIFASTVVAQAETKEEQRVWLGLFGRKNITTRYDLWAEVQLRRDESNQTMNQTLNRFGLLRKLNERHELGFLFAYVQSDVAKEYRPTLQHVYKTSLGNDSLSVRNRLEVRDIENDDADSLRFRSLVRFAHPMDERYELVFWDEPFLNLTRETWTGNRFVERNRIFAGVRINFKKFNCEVGYMNQYVPRKAKDVSEHILTTYLFF